jgi:hypothetical protein
MKRRDKHIRIIEQFEVDRFRHFERFTQRHGLRLFTDEAVEEYAAWLVSEARLHAKINRRNREIAAAKQVAA